MKCGSSGFHVVDICIVLSGVLESDATLLHIVQWMPPLTQ